jgi:hypothetical protein
LAPGRPPPQKARPVPPALRGRRAAGIRATPAHQEIPQRFRRQLNPASYFLPVKKLVRNFFTAMSKKSKKYSLHIALSELSLFQNPVGFGQALGKTGQKPGFPLNLRKLFQKLKFWNSLKLLNLLNLLNFFDFAVKP